MFVQEACDIAWTDVFPGLQEPPSQDAYSVRVCLDEISHDLCELDLVLEGRDLVFSPWQQRRQAVYVIRVDLRDVGVRDDDEG